ncbi:MAG: hypothetical protein QHH19_00485 [Candidatus Thermoplasmatota archaeon]|nr:hypothetical protein [Candidatus Thermoplasmatota archaeon]
MKRLHLIYRDSFRFFIKNKKAVLGLPMRLTVSLIIGAVALAAIVSYVLNPCLFPSKMIVSITPTMNIISGSDPVDLDIIVFVNEIDGHPIVNANVVVKGAGGLGSGVTDENGKTVIHITVKLEEGVNEDYLDVSVKAACRETFSQQDMIKIVKQ